ncbi:MAG: TonB-dependent receptor plug domain-containing protein [Bacteroidales bacterium]
MRLLLFIFSFLCVLPVFGQEVDIVDLETQQPIKDVEVFNMDKSSSAVSGGNGSVDITNFAKNSRFVFNHTSYQPYVISYENLRDNGFLVKLVPSTVNLDEVVVSANRWEQDQAEVPNKIRVIGQREIEFASPQTAADLLSETGEVFVQKSQQGGGSPMIRGFAANSVLLVFDGIRMNNPIFRQGNLQNVILIDPNAVESAEVIYGPGSVIYGSDALGGVMDFHTKEVKFSNNDKLRIKGDVLLRAASANSEKTGGFSLNIAGRKFGSFTNFSYSNFGDLIQGSKGNDYLKRSFYVVSGEKGDDVVKNNPNENRQVYSGYSQLNLLQKFRYKVNDKLELGYEFLYTNSSDIPRYDRLIQIKKGKPKYAEWYYGPQKWMINALKIKLGNVLPIFDEMKTTIAYQDYEESRNDRKFQSTKLRQRTEKVNGFNLNVDFVKNLGDRFQLFYGVEGLTNTIKSEGIAKNIETDEETPVESRYPNGDNKYLSGAAYADLKFHFAKAFTFNAGVRYTYTHLESSFGDISYNKTIPFDQVPEYYNMEVNNGALNGSFGLAYNPSKSLNLHFNVGSGFRAPNLDDISKVFDSGDGIIVVPNPNLKPEYAYSTNLGGVLKLNERFRLNADVFYTYLTDAIVRKPFTIGGKTHVPYDGDLGVVHALQNVGHAKVYGTSAGFSWDLARFLNVYSNATYTKGEDLDGNPLRHVSPFFGVTGFNVQFNKFRWNLNYMYNGEISNSNLAPSEIDKPYLYAKDANGKPYSPAWGILNTKISYQLKENLRAIFGVDNILDYRYKSYSSGISAPGRNFMLTVRANF